MTLMRTRWAAIGAAVAVTLGGGGIAMVSATSPADAVTYVPVTPCRVMDTRPGTDNVGPRSAALGPDDVHVVDAISNTDASGDCAGAIPGGATAVAMNVTAVDASAGTFLTMWDGSDPRPKASSLNPSPGQAPAPNAVTTNVNGDGEFSIFNRFGTVHVLADIVGYYIDHQHDDRYYTEAEVAALMPFAVSGEQTYGGLGAPSELTGTLEPKAWVDVTAPVDGVVTLNAYANVFHNVADGDVACLIFQAGDTEPPGLGTNFVGMIWFESEGPNSNDGTVSGTRQYTIDAGQSRTFEIRCAETEDGGRVFAAVITATFTPTL